MHLSWITLAAAATALALPSGPSPTPTLPNSLANRQDSTVTSSSTSSIPTGDFIATKYITIPGVTNSYVTVPAKTIDIAIPTCVQTIEPDANGYIPPGECGAIWNYYPSFAAAAVFAALFGILTAVHIWQAAKHKKRWCWVIIMASIWETLAFIFRAASSKNQQSNGIYLVFQIFILLAPIWVNAFAYMTLGRMIYFFHPSRSLLRIPAATFAAIFVALDIISFAVQLTGGSMAGPTAPPAEQMKAIHIYMGGIGLQEFFILIFVALALKFQVEMQSLDKLSRKQSRSWKPLLWALYFSLGMISVRIIYRLIEFSSGHGIDNVLITHEAYFYVLEALPMLLAIAVFNVYYSARGNLVSSPLGNRHGQLSVSAIVMPSQDSSPPRRLFLQMSGAPGAGKSTTANLLAQPLDAVILDLDVIKSSLLDNGVLFEQAAKLAYSTLWALAGSMLIQGRNLIVDCTCNYEEVITSGRALAEKVDFEYWYIECRPQVDIDVLDERLQKRVAMRSQRTGIYSPPVDSNACQGRDEQEALFRRWIENPYRPDGNVVVVDTSKHPNECREQVLQAMEK
ncbi:RTA1 domain-containing protein [Colletotrichum abscissum]|nr:RTA1 domain-containing protein [Colletotrichum abscissum]KAK1486133.1 RTA1 domain-containing protein [Colletotrichum abscissum]